MKKGGEDSFGEPERSHSELWLDFVEGMGGNRAPKRRPVGEVRKLISCFQRVAGKVLRKRRWRLFNAYESQVPRVRKKKDRGLREILWGQ